LNQEITKSGKEIFAEVEQKQTGGNGEKIQTKPDLFLYISIWI
jgi:hypothetical protein